MASICIYPPFSPLPQLLPSLLQNELLEKASVYIVLNSKVQIVCDLLCLIVTESGNWSMQWPAALPFGSPDYRSRLINTQYVI